jgi:ankyrin repeat protein
MLERLLAETGGNIEVSADTKDNDGRTPLSWAAAQGYEAVVKLLLAREDVEADAKDYIDQTPLWWAALGGHEAVVKLLLARDDVAANSKDSRDRIPLSVAVEAGYGREAATDAGRRRS